MCIYVLASVGSGTYRYTNSQSCLVVVLVTCANLLSIEICLMLECVQQGCVSVSQSLAESLEQALMTTATHVKQATRVFYRLFCKHIYTICIHLLAHIYVCAREPACLDILKKVWLIEVIYRTIMTDTLNNSICILFRNKDINSFDMSEL